MKDKKNETPPPPPPPPPSDIERIKIKGLHVATEGLGSNPDGSVVSNE